VLAVYLSDTHAAKSERVLRDESRLLALCLPKVKGVCLMVERIRGRLAKGSDAMGSGVFLIRRQRAALLRPFVVGRKAVLCVCRGW
jgi:hypothetical protein